MLKERQADLQARLTTTVSEGAWSEARLVAMLRAGDKLAFMELIGRHQAAMLRIARLYVTNEAIAEEVVQDTWLAVLGAFATFEGRSSVKTWLFRILVNRARTVRSKEHRHVPIMDLESAVDSNRFKKNGGWSSPPAPWVDEAEDRVRAERMAASIRTAIDHLPAAQREVLTLRDVLGLTAGEACRVLDVSDSHQRVLLCRARNRLRNALEAEFGESDP